MHRVSTGRMMLIAFVVGLVLSWAMTGEPAYLQYRVSDGVLLGAFAMTEDIRLGPGDAIIEWMPGVPPSALVWPTPATCPTGTLEWALMGSGNSVPPVLNPALVFYRCTVVTSKREVYSAVRAEIIRAAQPYLGDGSDRVMLLVADAYRECPLGNNSANCPEIRAAADVIKTLLRGKGQQRTALEAGAAAKLEGDKLIDAQCKLAPAGPFC